MEIASKRPAADRGLPAACSRSRPRRAAGCRPARRRPRPATAARPPAATAWLAGSVVDRRAPPGARGARARVPLAGDGGAGRDAVRDRRPTWRATSASPTCRRAPIGCWSRRPGFPTAETAPVTAPVGRRRCPRRRRGAVDRRAGRARPGAPVAGARVLLAPDGGGPLRETVDARGRRVRLRRPRRRPLRGARRRAATRPRAPVARDRGRRRARPARARPARARRRAAPIAGRVDRRRRRRARRRSGAHRDRRGRAGRRSAAHARAVAIAAGNFAALRVSGRLPPDRRRGRGTCCGARRPWTRRGKRPAPPQVVLELVRGARVFGARRRSARRRRRPARASAAWRARSRI